jgi:hypothetical protein
VERVGIAILLQHSRGTATNSFEQLVYFEFSSHSACIIVEKCGSDSKVYITEYSRVTSLTAEIPGADDSSVKNPRLASVRLKSKRLASGRLKSKLTLPYAAFKGKSNAFDNVMSDYILGLKEKDCEYPKEEREAHFPVHIFEFLVPQMQQSSIECPSIQVTADFEESYHKEDSWNGLGAPWRRCSVHVTSLKNTLRPLLHLIFKKRGKTPKEAKSIYKLIMLYYLMWLAKVSPPPTVIAIFYSECCRRLLEK